MGAGLALRLHQLRRPSPLMCCRRPPGACPQPRLGPFLRPLPSPPASWSPGMPCPLSALSCHGACCAPLPPPSTPGPVLLPSRGWPLLGPRASLLSWFACIPARSVERTGRGPRTTRRRRVRGALTRAARSPSCSSECPAGGSLPPAGLARTVICRAHHTSSSSCSLIDVCCCPPDWRAFPAAASRVWGAFLSPW